MTKKRNMTLQEVPVKEDVAAVEKPSEAKVTKSSHYKTSFYLPESVHVALKKMAAVERGKKVNDYFLEGLELFFKERGVPMPKDNS